MFSTTTKSSLISFVVFYEGKIFNSVSILFSPLVCQLCLRQLSFKFPVIFTKVWSISCGKLNLISLIAEMLKLYGMLKNFRSKSEKNYKFSKQNITNRSKCSPGHVECNFDNVSQKLFTLAPEILHTFLVIVFIQVHLSILEV